MDNVTIDGVNYNIIGYDSACLRAGGVYKCIHRYRKSRYNTIYGRIQYKDTYYYLLGEDGLVVVLGRYETIRVITNNLIRVTNIKVSSDGRIYLNDEYEKELKRRSDELSNFRTEVKQYDNTTDNTNMNKGVDNNLEVKQPETKSNKNLNIYKEEIRPGLVLEVGKTDWKLRYMYVNNEYGEDAFWNRDTVISGKDIDIHIEEIKSCYYKIQERLKERGGEDWGNEWGAYLCDDKYKVKYMAEVGKFVFWPKYTNVKVVGYNGIKELVRDLEQCKTKVEQIRYQLGWKSHKGFIGRLLRAY